MDEDKQSLDRRALLVGGGAAAGVWAINKAFDGGWDLVTKLTRQAELADMELASKIKAQEYRNRMLGDLFGFFDERVHVKPGANHPDYFSVHPDNLEVTHHYVGALRQDGINVRRSDSNDRMDCSGNIILVGDPVSNSFTAAALRYKPIASDPKGRAREFEHVDGNIKYPFRLIINDKELTDFGVVERVREDKPNTSILDLGNNKRLFVPEISGASYVTDYLLVTKLPNFFDKESYYKGNHIIILSGTHGPGTLGAAVMMRDSETLMSIHDQVKDCGDSWQAVIKCTDLPPWRGSINDRQPPGRIDGAPICAPVEIDHEAIKSQFEADSREIFI